MSKFNPFTDCSETHSMFTDNITDAESMYTNFHSGFFHRLYQNGHTWPPL